MNWIKPPRNACAIILSFFSFVASPFATTMDRFFITAAHAGDWPQVLGPHRNGQAVSEKPIASDWKTNPPKLLWQVYVGNGFSGAAVVAGTAYLFDRSGNDERLMAVDLKTGKEKWHANWPSSYRASINPDNGPRAVPLVSTDRVVCYGAAGDLVCIDLQSGKIVWKRPLRKELGAEDGYFGAGSSPILIGKTIVINVGGKTAGIVGIDLANGKTLWQSTNYDASYASPVAVAGDKPRALVVTRLKTVLVDVATGKALSEINFGARGPTVNAATPLQVGDNRFLLTASYGIGAVLVKVDGDQLKTEWKQSELLASQYNSPVLWQGLAIGANGREDLGDVSLRAINFEEQQVVWNEPISGPTHIIAIENQLLLVGLTGELSLGVPSLSSFEKQASFSMDTTQLMKYRALPAYADGILVVRANDDGQSSEFRAYAMPH